MIIVKKCSKCGEVKPISKFYREAYDKSRFRSKCKECIKKYQKGRNILNKWKE